MCNDGDDRCRMFATSSHSPIDYKLPPTQNKLATTNMRTAHIHYCAILVCMVHGVCGCYAVLYIMTYFVLPRKPAGNIYMTMNRQRSCEQTARTFWFTRSHLHVSRNIIHKSTQEKTSNPNPTKYDTHHSKLKQNHFIDRIDQMETID